MNYSIIILFIKPTERDKTSENDTKPTVFRKFRYFLQSQGLDLKTVPI